MQQLDIQKYAQSQSLLMCDSLSQPQGQLEAGERLRIPSRFGFGCGSDLSMNDFYMQTVVARNLRRPLNC